MVETTIAFIFLGIGIVGMVITDFHSDYNKRKCVCKDKIELKETTKCGKK